LPERSAAAVVGPRPFETPTIHGGVPRLGAPSDTVSLPPADAVRQHAELVRQLAPRWSSRRAAEPRSSLLPAPRSRVPRVHAWRRAWSALVAHITWHRGGPAVRVRQAALLALMVPLALAPGGERQASDASVTAARAAVDHAPAGAVAGFGAVDAATAAAPGFGSSSGWEAVAQGGADPNLLVLGGTAPSSVASVDANATPAASAAPRRSTARRNAVSSPAPLTWRTAIASFYDWNTWGFGAPGGQRGHTACGIRYTRDLVAVAAPPGMFACGTKIAFRASGSSRVIVVPVLDSGYFSQLDSRRLWDLTSQACLLLKHCYTGTIEWAFPNGS